MPEPVAVSGELAFNRIAPGATGLTLRSPAHPDYGHQIHGAQLMVNSTPKEMHWWTVVNGSTLEVHRRDVYQMARWAPLLEKAIERFSRATASSVTARRSRARASTAARAARPTSAAAGRGTR